ncbi:glutamate receptor 1 [Plakobranchus ocellatus]|uniref:Glutamate receptor 1 n=1 Tax=Plakobranchus ocellatus TaxID=259542 RepID=A0AAV3YP87_9GAST|nr:glutamate receptor 1 [Plakobranchus ocellatus]
MHTAAPDPYNIPIGMIFDQKDAEVPNFMRRYVHDYNERNNDFRLNTTVVNLDTGDSYNVSRACEYFGKQKLLYCCVELHFASLVTQSCGFYPY